MGQYNQYNSSQANANVQIATTVPTTKLLETAKRWKDVHFLFDLSLGDIKYYDPSTNNCTFNIV